MTEPPAIVGHKFVERINHRGQSKRFEQAANHSQSRQFGQQRHTPARIACDGRAIAQD